VVVANTDVVVQEWDQPHLILYGQECNEQKSLWRRMDSCSGEDPLASEKLKCLNLDVVVGDVEIRRDDDIGDGLMAWVIQII
jgi:hypothetical protein